MATIVISCGKKAEKAETATATGAQTEVQTGCNKTNTSSNCCATCTPTEPCGTNCNATCTSTESCGTNCNSANAATDPCDSKATDSNTACVATDSCATSVATDTPCAATATEICENATTDTPCAATATEICENVATDTPCVATATEICENVANTEPCEAIAECAIATMSTISSPAIKVEEVDTLSYIFGMDMSNRIENEIIPVFQIDYNTMMSALEQALDPNAIISVEGEQFNKENYREIGDKYISNSDLRTRIMIAMSDSTAQIYNDEKEKLIVSAILGADFAYSASNAGLELDHNSFKNAIYDYHNGNAIFTDEFAMEYTRNYFTVVIPQQNKAKSEAWLAEIEKQEGVQKTASGILYKIVNAGNDSIKAVKDEDVVKVLYTGSTKDGKVFDSNRWNDMPSDRQEMMKAYQPDQAEKDNPIEFPLNRVIKGWTEGMKLVGKGGRIILWIPSELAYGERGTGQDIGPNEALCFDVELLDVTNK